MTHDELREAAVKAAREIRHHHRLFYGGTRPGEGEESAWESSHQRLFILARYILSLHDETPVTVRAVADAVYELIDKRDAICTAGQLRMIRAASLPHAGETGASE